MQIQVNNKGIELAPSSTIRQLINQLELPEKGIAIAVNNKMVPRSEWDAYSIQENDSLVIIKAACGG